MGDLNFRVGEVNTEVIRWMGTHDEETINANGDENRFFQTKRVNIENSATKSFTNLPAN